MLFVQTEARQHGSKLKMHGDADTVFQIEIQKYATVFLMQNTLASSFTKIHHKDQKMIFLLL